MTRSPRPSDPAAAGARHGDDDPPPLTSLRNYGRSFAESEPRGRAKRRILYRALRVLRRELGTAALARILWRSRRLRSQADASALSALGERGLRDRAFLAARLEETSLAAAVVERLGLERATDLYRQLLEAVAGDVMRELVPTAEELGAFPDPFAAFCGYLAPILEANAKAGIHVTVVREQSADRLAYDVTYCAYERVAAALGQPALCYVSSCLADEITFPRLCGALGARFLRQGTLATGAPCCDFRFERVVPSATR